MSNDLTVELTVTCTVGSLKAAEDALKNARTGCELAGWEVEEAWLRRREDLPEPNEDAE